MKKKIYGNPYNPNNPPYVANPFPGYKLSDNPNLGTGKINANLNYGGRGQNGIESIENQKSPITSSADTSDSNSNPILTEIDGYKILNEIGKGNSGDVFRVEKGNHLYALKLYNFSTNIEAETIQFEKEIEFLSNRINHVNIIKYCDWNLAKKYVVMELLGSSN